MSLSVRFTQSPERRGVFEYALRVEVVSSDGMSPKIFVYHQFPKGLEGNTYAEFDHIATTVDLQEIPEDAASDIVPWYRTDKCTVWLRNAHDLDIAKQLFIDDIAALSKAFGILSSEENFVNQETVEFDDGGASVQPGGGSSDSISERIGKLEEAMQNKVDKDALSGVDIKANTADAMRESVETIGSLLGGNVVGMLAVAFGLLAAPVSGASVASAEFNKLDLDEHPMVVTNVTFDGLADAATITNVVTNVVDKSYVSNLGIQVPVSVLDTIHDVYPIATPVVCFDSKTSVKVLGDTRFYVDGTSVYIPSNTVVDVSGETTIPGTDYFVHLTSTTNLTVSTNAVESGARCLGGFHAICRDVPSDLEMAPTNVFAGILHPLAGWSAGNILPKSVWSLNFRPSCPDPTGMVYVRECDVWVDIYNASGSIYAPETKFGGTRLHTRGQVAFMTGLGNVGKRLLDDEEFWYAAIGSNCGTKVAGAARPSPDTTGGRFDTAGYPMVSAIGCEEMCGLQAQWLRDTHANSGGSWDVSTYPTKAYDDGDNTFGSMLYMAQYRAVLAGGTWGTAPAVVCGPLFRNASASRSGVYVNGGGRGSCPCTRAYVEQ